MRHGPGYWNAPATAGPQVAGGSKTGEVGATGHLITGFRPMRAAQSKIDQGPPLGGMDTAGGFGGDE